jgi:hypothetical protein
MARMPSRQTPSLMLPKTMLQKQHTTPFIEDDTGHAMVKFSIEQPRNGLPDWGRQAVPNIRDEIDQDD